MKKYKYKYKYKIIWILLALLLLGTVQGQSYADIDVQTLDTEPYPIEPGDNFVLSVGLTNNGSTSAKEVNVKIDPDSPFTVTGSSQKKIGKLGNDNSAVVEYDLFVQNSAVSAVYKIPVWVTYKINSMSTTIKDEIEVRVRGTPDFELLDMKMPGEMSPGDRINISVEIQNIGTGNAKKTTILFESDSDYVKAIHSKGRKYLGTVNPKEKKEIIFNLLIDPEAEYKVYNSNITVEYTNESGEENSESFSVGILITGKPKLQVIKTEVDQQDKELEVEISNIGSAQAKSITANLIYENKTLDVDYLTRMDIDRHSTIRFNLPKINNALLELKYEGPDNKQYLQKQFISWNTTKKSSWNWILGLIGLLFVILVIWKRKVFKQFFK